MECRVRLATYGFDRTRLHGATETNAKLIERVRAGKPRWHLTSGPFRSDTWSIHAYTAVRLLYNT